MVTPAVALLLTLSSGVAVGVGAGVRTETRAGLIPTNATGPADPSVDVELVPSGNITLSKGLSAFNANYSVRLLRRFFVPTVQRFIILHQAGVGYSDTFGRGWRFVSTVGANLGEVDYASSATFVGQTGVTPNDPNQTNQTASTQTTTGLAPNNPVIPLLTINAQVGLNGAVGRNHSLGFSLTGTHQRSLGTDTPTTPQNTPVSLLQEQLGAGINVAYGYAATINLGLTLGAGLDFNRSGSAANGGAVQTFQSGNVEGGVSYQFSPKISGSTSLGVLVSEGTTGFLLSPVGAINLNAAWIDTRALRMSTLLTVGADGQPNTITGSFEPRLTSGLIFGFAFGTDWTVAVTGEFATPLPIDRTGTTTPMPQQDGFQTIIGGSIPVSYRISDAVSFEFGARAQIAASRLDAPVFQYGSPNFTGYVALTASASSGL